LPEDKQTSKHGGGGRYDAIFKIQRGAIKKKKFKGVQIKKIKTPM
jgi:hypothetical protein